MTDGPDIKGERAATAAAGIAWRDGDEPRVARSGRIAIPWLVRQLAEIESTMALGNRAHLKMRVLLRQLTAAREET